MNSADKKILKEKPDEVIIYKKRINGKLVTVHNIKIIYRPFKSRRHWIVYNNEEVGHGTITQIMKRLRERIINFA